MIDSHAHLDGEAFAEDGEEIIEQLADEGIDFVVNIGADLDSSKASAALAQVHERIYATVGVHPHDALTYNDQVEKELIALAQQKKVVAIGEIGLDFYYDYSPREVQREVFWRQLALADQLHLPVVIHSRDAAQETYDILKEAHAKYDFQAIIHCFSQSVEMMKGYVAMGDFIGLGGAVTFKNAKVPKEVALHVPLEHLVLETDCPYMTPVPYRGKRNEPKYIKKTAQYIAELRNMEVEELVRHTDRNTKRFYGI